MGSECQIRSTRSRSQLGLVVAGLLLLLVLPALGYWLAMPDLVTLGTEIVINALAAVSLDLLIGYSGLPSFGHAAFFGLGGYVVGIMANGGSLLGVIPGSTAALVAWPAAIGIAALAALAIGALSVRTSGVQFIMITLAFAEMIYFLFLSLKGYGGSDGMSFRHRDGLPLLDLRDDATFYYVSLAILVAFVAFCRRMMRSRFGMVLQGIRQNERRMAALGLATGRYKLAIFTIAGAAAGLAGALNANLLRFVSPDMLHWTVSGDLTAMVVLGGSGSIFGPVIGALVIVAAQNWLAQWTDHWMIFLGPLFVLVVLFAPRGIWGLLSGTGRTAFPRLIVKRARL